MSDPFISSYHNPDPYIPASLGEIYDLLGSMFLGAPTFIDGLGVFPDRNIDSEFHALTEGAKKVRKKLGEERYVQVIDLAGQAKTLFSGDPNDNNGKADRGRLLLYEIEKLIQDARSRRVATKRKDDEGGVAGD
jgi:hypothetical protein